MSDVQVLHLATLHEGAYGYLYAVRVRVIFTVREGNRLLRAVVKDIESGPGSGPTYELDLFIHGRWQCALINVHNGSRLCLQCPRVRLCGGTSNSSRLSLHLEDFSTSKTPSKFQAVRVLNDRLEPFHTVTFQTLSSAQTLRAPGSCLQATGLLKESANSCRKRQRTGADAKPVILQPRANVRPSPRGPTTGVGKKSDHDYKKIAHVIDSVDSLMRAPVNVFGVVIDARAACVTRGTGLRSEISIADESCYNTDEVALKTLQVYTFEDYIMNAIPFRAYGDVVCVRRGLVEQYTDVSTGTSTAQLNIKFYAAVIVWQYDTDSLQPCLSRMALNKSKSNDTFELPPADQSRIHELRTWVRKFIHRRFRSPRNYIYTVPEILNRASLADESVQMLDIVAQVCYVSEEGLNLCLRITDGLKQPGLGEQIITLRSEVDKTVMSRAKATKFHDFQRGWGNRPNLPAWVLLKDVRVITIAGTTLYLLRMDKFSSTILFLDDDAPLVRMVKEQYLNVGGNNFQESNAAVPLQPCTDVQRVEIRKRIQMKAPHVRSALKLDSMEGCRISTRDRGSLGKDSVKLTQTEPLYDRIPLSEISDMFSDFNSGKEIVHRLLVSVVACMSPRNIALVIRPICRNCNSYAQITPEGDLEKFRCDNCAQMFESREDSRLRWTVVVQLLVKDFSGRAVELWIEGDEGEKFFGCSGGFTDGNDESGTRRIRSALNAVTLPRHVLECCVFAYKYTDKNDVPHVACKVVGTKLLSGFISKDSKRAVPEN